MRPAIWVTLAIVLCALGIILSTARTGTRGRRGPAAPLEQSVQRPEPNPESHGGARREPTAAPAEAGGSGVRRDGRSRDVPEPAGSAVGS